MYTAMGNLARALQPRLRAADGFGLVELMIALTVLVIGVFATFGVFEASLLHLHRATKVTTATAVGEQQIENFRALRYDGIGLSSASFSTAVGNAVYTGDTACGGTCTVSGTGAGQSVVLASGGTPAIGSAQGADGKTYRVDTYVVWQTITNGRTVKKVTVLVRDQTTNKVWARIVSSFDQSTGL
jgi:Tfp pilus assembly protein PilV